MSNLTPYRVNARSTNARQAVRTHPIPAHGMRVPEQFRDRARALASTPNPKVAGSIPARPIAPERNRDSERQTTQSVREITKTRTTRRIQRSPPVPEREEALALNQELRRIRATRVPFGATRGQQLHGGEPLDGKERSTLPDPRTRGRSSFRCVPSGSHGCDGGRLGDGNALAQPDRRAV